jgi:hypothetical protein
MTATAELVRLHVEALFTRDPRGRIAFVNEPGGDRAPRFYFARSTTGNVWRCRDDLAADVVQALEQVASAEPVHDDLRAAPRNVDGFLAALRIDRDRAAIDSGPAYRFPEQIAPVAATRITRSGVHRLKRLSWDLEETQRSFEAREPFLAVLEDGAAVALCHSARLTAQAAEAGLQTLAEYRRRGHASAVTAAWALAIRATARIPLYSTSWGNVASQGVARRLGLVQYGVELSIM